MANTRHEYGKDALELVPTRLAIGERKQSYDKSTPGKVVRKVHYSVWSERFNHGIVQSEDRNVMKTAYV